MTMTEGPVVVLGDVMSDISARLAAPPVPGSDTPARIEMRPGGAGANVAAWLARLGAPVVLIGCVGDDDAVEGAEVGDGEAAVVVDIDGCVAGGGVDVVEHDVGVDAAADDQARPAGRERQALAKQRAAVPVAGLDEDGCGGHDEVSMAAR